MGLFFGYQSLSEPISKIALMIRMNSATTMQTIPIPSINTAFTILVSVVGPNSNAPKPKNIAPTAMSISKPWANTINIFLTSRGPSRCFAFIATSLRLTGSSKAPFFFKITLVHNNHQMHQLATPSCLQ